MSYSSSVIITLGTGKLDEVSSDLVISNENAIKVNLHSENGRCLQKCGSKTCFLDLEKGREETTQTSFSRSLENIFL